MRIDRCELVLVDVTPVGKTSALTRRQQKTRVVLILASVVCCCVTRFIITIAACMLLCVADNFGEVIIHLTHRAVQISDSLALSQTPAEDARPWTRSQCVEWCLFTLDNGRYGHAPIRSDTSIRVYTTADTDTSTPCVGVPATCNIRPGRSLRTQLICNWWHTLSKVK